MALLATCASIPWDFKSMFMYLSFLCTGTSFHQKSQADSGILNWNLASHSCSKWSSLPFFRLMMAGLVSLWAPPPAFRSRCLFSKASWSLSIISRDWVSTHFFRRYMPSGLSSKGQRTDKASQVPLPEKSVSSASMSSRFSRSEATLLLSVAPLVFLGFSPVLLS